MTNDQIVESDSGYSKNCTDADFRQALTEYMESDHSGTLYVALAARCGDFVFSSKLLKNPTEDQVDEAIDNYNQVYINQCPKAGYIEQRSWKVS